MFRRVISAFILALAVSAAQAQSQDPIKHLFANFDRIDGDGDGVISRAEYRSIKAARWPQIDSNGDGYLTEDDFPQTAARRAKAQLVGIAYLDANDDGRICQSEFLNGPASSFTQADRNFDGVLSRAEVHVPES